MAFKMQRAFNSKMLTKMQLYTVTQGAFDENNIWVEGYKKKKNIWGVIQVGNKFSQFDEGEALHSEDGGARFSNFKSLYVTDRFPIKLADKIKFAGEYFNVLQRSDESVYGFYSVLLERTEDWAP